MNSRQIQTISSNSRRWIVALGIGSIVYLAVVVILVPGLGSAISDLEGYAWFFGFVPGLAMGIGASILGRKALRSIPATPGNKSVRQPGRTGVILGSTGIAVNVLSLLAAFLIYFFAGSSIDNSLHEGLERIGNDAHAYWIQHAGVSGGKGSYLGYTLPTDLRENEHAFFTLTFVSADSIRVNASAKADSLYVIWLAGDSEGRWRIE